MQLQWCEYCFISCLEINTSHVNIITLYNNISYSVTIKTIEFILVLKAQLCFGNNTLEVYYTTLFMKLRVKYLKNISSICEN